jgi:hypothetical protein
MNNDSTLKLDEDQLWSIRDEADEGRLPSPLTVARMAELIHKLRQEVETLRQYGNKDCTAMADEVLTENK